MIVDEEVEWIKHKWNDDTETEICAVAWAAFADRDYNKITHAEYIQTHLEVCKDWNEDMGEDDSRQIIKAFTIKFKDEEPVTVEVK